jgi:hypothetical protein
MVEKSGQIAQVHQQLVGVEGNLHHRQFSSVVKPEEEVIEFLIAVYWNQEAVVADRYLEGLVGPQQQKLSLEQMGGEGQMILQ